MDEVEFDKFADEYYSSLSAGITASGEGPEYFSEYKIKDISREWRQQHAVTGSPVKILDFGAGIGNSVPYVSRYFPNAQLTCLDPSKRSLDIARKCYPIQAEYVHFDGSRIPFPDSHFDIAYAMCVFHHIDHADHVSLLQELRRVIRPKGSLFIFEHNPYNPLTVRVVNNCPFDANARLIHGSDMKQRLLAAGFSSARTSYRIFFPRILRALRPLEMGLTWLPLGGQYYVRSCK
jgi:ubiquinone/menaquinone biosynthesis C-methylase UbiE